MTGGFGISPPPQPTFDMLGAAEHVAQPRPRESRVNHCRRHGLLDSTFPRRPYLRIRSDIFNPKTETRTICYERGTEVDIWLVVAARLNRLGHVTLSTRPQIVSRDGSP